MYNIVVLTDDAARMKAALPVTEDIEYSFTSSADVQPDTECVLISQEHFGEDIGKTAETLRKHGIPCAVATFDGSDENKAKLSADGITETIVFPTSAELLTKHITAMLSSLRIGTDVGFEMFAKAVALDDQRGAFVVHESNFTNIYRFVKRLLDRSEKTAYLVKFTFSSEGGEAGPGALEEAFLIIKMCLRRGDIISIYGNCILAILMGADADGSKTAAQRIVDTYQGFSCDSTYEMSYETQQIK